MGVERESCNNCESIQKFEAGRGRGCHQLQATVSLVKTFKTTPDDANYASVSGTETWNAATGRWEREDCYKFANYSKEDTNYAPSVMSLGCYTQKRGNGYTNMRVSLPRKILRNVECFSAMLRSFYIPYICCIWRLLDASKNFFHIKD